MDSPDSTHNDFLKKLSEHTEANFTNQQFGVSMLAKEMGMSRSNLHRKVNSELKISVSQFINQVRLKKAKDILRHSSDTVSEVAYKVGYNNVSYFIKCFHEFYGYSPGEVGNREETENDTGQTNQTSKKQLRTILVSAFVLVGITAALIIIFKPFQFQQKKLENTIAILPPRIEIQDTSYSTTIDGIVQNLIDNLYKIQDVKKVIAWHSVLQYRNNFIPASIIAPELKVNYVLKPTVRNIEGKTNLSITLIEGIEDKLLWSDNYQLDSNNVTTVHLDIIKDITDELDISITPTEQLNIDKIVTSNKKALNQYWKGVEILNRRSLGRTVDLEEAIACFKKATDYDDECAAAYAQLAITYYFMDYHWTDENNPEHEILYAKEINKYADIANRIDPRLDLSLIAKAAYYMNEKEYELAINFLKDALSYNPNSYAATLYLCNIYDIVDESEKFIKYALKVVETDFPEIDLNYDRELGKEMIYNQLGAEYRARGFFNKALMYHNMAIETNPEYLPSINQKSQVICDLGNYQESIDLLLDLTSKDSTTLGYPFLGLSYYLIRDYQNANITFKKWFELTENSAEDYQGIASGRLAVIFKETGQPEKAQMQIENYRDRAESSGTLRNKSYRLTGYYSFIGDTAKALEHLKIMSQYNQQYFKIRLLRDAPLYDNIRELPDFQELITKMQTRWQERRDSIRVVFEKKGLL